MINLHKEELPPKKTQVCNTRPTQADNSGKSSAQLKQDFFRLQLKLKRKKEFIEGINPDSGQGFGARLSELAECCSAAASAAGSDIAQAYDCLVRAMKAAEWIESNLTVREQIRSQQEQCVQQKAEADRYESENLSCVLYEQAEECLKAGNAAFDAGVFAEAEEQFLSAASFFEEAAKESKELKQQDLLEACKLAEKFENWRGLWQRAEELRSFDPEKAGKFQNTAVEHSSNFTITLPGNIALELIKIEAGVFLMSRPDGENYSDETPHSVTLTKVFYLGKYAVTQAQWKAVMGYNLSHFKGDNLPVECVSWFDAIKFCEALNNMSAAPANWRFTLPTETQWEYAAQGGKKHKGCKYSGSDNIDTVAWCNGNSGTHPVGQKAPNELGLFDMSGNVREWCLDDYAYESSLAIPEFSRQGDISRLNRICRGGTWDVDAQCCRVAHRSGEAPDKKFSNLGFRLALVPVQ